MFDDLEKYKKRLIDVFLELVKISSPTGEVEEFGDFLFAYFRAKGFVAERDDFGNLKFKTCEFNPERSLLLTTHIDTVSPGKNIKPIIEGSIIKSDGKTILGADPKSGIAAIMTAVEYFSKIGEELRDLEIIFSTNEEEGDHTLQFAEVASKKALVLDNADKIENIIYKSPFAKVFDIKVSGREVYAQLDYDKGANAILALNDVIKNSDWGFYKKGCVANTGIISGGTSTTVVPGSAHLKGNVYCFQSADVEDYIEKIKKISAGVDKKYGTKTKVEILEKYSGAFVDLNDEFVRQVKEIYKQNGVKVNFCEELLISSNNCLTEKGVKSLNLGMGYENCHRRDEKIFIDKFEKFFEILVGLIRSFK